MSQAGVEEKSGSGGSGDGGDGGGGGGELSQPQSVSEVGHTTSLVTLEPDESDDSSTSSFQLVSPLTEPSSPFVPDADGSSPFVPDADGSSPFVPDADGSSPFVPDAERSSPFSPDPNGSSPFAPDTKGSFPFTADTNDFSPLAPDSNRSSTFEPDADKSSELSAGSREPFPQSSVVTQPCERDSEGGENKTLLTPVTDDSSTDLSDTSESSHSAPGDTEDSIQLIPDNRKKSPISPKSNKSSEVSSDSDEDTPSKPAVFGSSDFELEDNGPAPDGKEPSPSTVKVDDNTLTTPGIDGSTQILPEIAETTQSPPEVEKTPEIVAPVGKSTPKVPEVKPATPLKPDPAKNTQVTPEPAKTTQIVPDSTAKTTQIVPDSTAKTTQIVPDSKAQAQQSPETKTSPEISREVKSTTQSPPESFQRSKLTADSNGSPNLSASNVDDYAQQTSPSDVHGYTQHTSPSDESTLLLIPSDDNEAASPSTSNTTASAPCCRSTRIPIPGCLDTERIMATSLEDITSLRLWKGIIAEFVGVLLLVLVGCGSCVSLSDKSSSSVVQIALCFGLSVATIVWNIGHISGGHINPAVTLALLATRKISLAKAIFFVLFQLVGAVVGAGILMGLTPEEFQGNLGATLVNENLDAGKGFGVELFITFVLVFTVFASIDSKRRDLNGSTPLTVGLSVTMCHLFAVQYTGASMNTARSFGPALVTGNWDDHWVYWVGPIGGGVLAGLLYEYLFAVNASLNKVRACVLSSDYDNEKIQAKKIKVRIVEEDPEAPGENLSLTHTAEKLAIEEQ